MCHTPTRIGRIEKRGRLVIQARWQLDDPFRAGPAEVRLSPPATRRRVEHGYIDKQGDQVWPRAND